MCAWCNKLLKLKKLSPETTFKNEGIELAGLNTVEPPLTVTSLQRPIFFFGSWADSPYVDPCLSLSTTAKATKVCAQLPN